MVELSDAVTRVLEAVREAGGRPLVVGGAVRDALLGQRTGDFDVEVYGLSAEELTRTLATVGRVHIVGRAFGVMKVTLDGSEVDVSLPRRESKSGRGHRGFLVEPDPTMTPEQAASRRDFTINALAYDPRSESEPLLDYFGGVEDLRQGVLRHVGPAFADDPLRVLRGVQIAARFDLEAASQTIELSRRLFDEYETLSIERVWGEWLKWAGKAQVPSRGLEFLRQSGWWAAYPELQALHGCPQQPQWHPEGDVWTHTLIATDAAAKIARREGLDDGDKAVLLLAALCHDLGKPETTVTDEGPIRSPNHAACEPTFRRFLGRIGAPRGLTERVVALSRQHLAHMGFTGSSRHVRRVARALGEAHENIQMLARLVEADHSARPPLAGGLPEAMARMLEVAEELSAAEAAPKPLLQGRHLLALGVEPGPEMGRLLDRAYEAQLDGSFEDVEGARGWLQCQLGERGEEN